jgi:uncharacterized membrane protein
MEKREQPSSARSLDTSAEATARSSRLYIETIAEFERDFLQQRTLPERIADAIGKFAGSFTSVILHGLWFGGWVFINLGMVVPGIQPFDEFPFHTLQLLVALEAIFLSTFVLMRQNRLDTLADQHTHLALQINLLAEKETTKILQMLQSICDRLDLEELARDKETQRLSEETHLETLERELKEKLPDEHK